MSLITRNKTVASAGTPEAIGTDADGSIVEIDIMALEGNTGDVYVGYSGVDASAKVGIVLHPGDAWSQDDDESKIRLAGRKLSEIYIDSDTSSDGVTIVCRTTE